MIKDTYTHDIPADLPHVQGRFGYRSAIAICGARVELIRGDSHQPSCPKCQARQDDVQAVCDSISDYDDQRARPYVPARRRPLPDDWEPDNDQLEDRRR